MIVSEAQRRQMHTRLAEVLGTEVADTVMEHLPPAGWADLATKHDLDAHQAATKRDIAELAAATKRDIEALDAKCESIRTTLQQEMRNLGIELRGEVDSKLALQTRTMMFGLFTTMFGTIGVVGAITALGH